VPVVLIDPAYTSRTCNECGHCEKANRKSQAQFVCRSCSHSANADVNAARNIKKLAVPRPGQRQLSYGLETVTVSDTSSRALAGSI